VDYVFNFASPASPPEYLRLAIETLRVGSVGVENTLEIAAKYGAGFLHASTSECYGDPLQHPQSENYWGHVNPVGPRSVYDEAKRYAEALVMAYHRSRGVNTHHGSLRLRASSKSRNLLRQAGQLAGAWIGRGMAYSNNAENIYSFRINRVEPLYIPLLSRLLGQFRYDFMVGPLRGHTYMPYIPTVPPAQPPPPDVTNPGNPWVHVEKVSFKPTRDLEFGFERTAIWGGKGHEPITLHTFIQ
jgi:hypothetical protein